MTDTTTASTVAPIVASPITSVLARIAAIQSRITSVTTATVAGPSTDFSTALASAQSTTSAPVTNPIGTVNGVTYSQRSANVTGADVVADAESYLGVPYVYAGNGRSGIDCSGLVQETYKDLGMSLPRIADQQQHVGTPVASLADAQPGDVLYFGNPAYHVAIYLGDNKMIEAPQPGEKVKIATVSPPPDGIRRIVATAGATNATAAAAVSYPAGVATYAAQLQAATTQYGLPAGLLGAVATAESGGNPNAVSPAGALGLMQLMPGTAKSLGVDPLVPAQAIDGAASMLSGLLRKYNGSVPLATAAYNAGPGAVDKYGGVPPYTETQNYVARIAKLMAGGV